MNKLFLLIIAMIASVLSLPLTTNISVNASEEEDINVLILTANTPEEHMKDAANDYKSLAQEHQKMAQEIQQK